MILPLVRRDRSRTPALERKGKGGSKGKGSGKKGKKPVKVASAPEGEDVERVGRRYYPRSSKCPGIMARKETGGN